MKVYGIKNCDTVKKSLQWLNDNGVAYEFHDYKANGITEEKLNTWIKQVGWEPLVNKKGMTWRQLDDSVKQKVTNQHEAIKLMMEKTSVIKRPLLEENNLVVTIGFDENEYKRKLR